LRPRASRQKAAWLRAQWEKKVRYFLYDDPHPWISECRSTRPPMNQPTLLLAGALQDGAKLKPGRAVVARKNSGRWYSYPVIDRKRRMDFLTAGNFSQIWPARAGWKRATITWEATSAPWAAAYTLSYMSQWAAGRSSIRPCDSPTNRPSWHSWATPPCSSSWALVNIGRAETNLAFCYPRRRARRARSPGAFSRKKFGRGWNPACQAIAPDLGAGWRNRPRADGRRRGSGHGGDRRPDLRPASLRGLLRSSDQSFEVVPGRRPPSGSPSSAIASDCTWRSNADGFREEEPIIVGPSLSELRFRLENARPTGTPRALLYLVNAGDYDVLLHGQPHSSFRYTPAGGPRRSTTRRKPADAGGDQA